MSLAVLGLLVCGLIFVWSVVDVIAIPEILTVTRLKTGSPALLDDMAASGTQDSETAPADGAAASDVRVLDVEEPLRDAPDSPAGDPLTIGAVLEVRVVSRADEQRLANVRITVLDARDGSMAIDEVRETGPQGRSRFRVPSNTPLRVLVTGSGTRAPTASQDVLPIPAHEARELLLRIDPGLGCRVEGLVIDQDARPVEGIPLVLSHPGGLENVSWASERVSPRTVSDTDGRYAFDDVLPGWWCITPGSRDASTTDARDGIAGAITYFQLSASSEARTLNISMHRGLYISGQVLDVHGDHARAGIDVGSGEAWAESGPDGRFCVGPLRPGRWSVEASAHGARSAVVVCDARSDGVELRLQHVGSIHGTSFDEVTGARREASVWLMSSGRRVASASRDGGDFWFENVLPGTYALRAEGSVWDEALGRNVGFLGVESGVEVEPGARLRYLRVLTQPAATLAISITDPNLVGRLDLVDQNVVVTSQWLDYRVSSGQFQVAGGPYLVRFTREGSQRSAVRTGVAIAGETHRIVFEKAPW